MNTPSGSLLIHIIMDSYADVVGEIDKKGEELLRALKKGDPISIEDLTLRLKEIVDLAKRQSPLIENIFKTTIYSIGDAVIATDREGKITLLNPVAEQLTGWSEKDAEGRLLGEVFRIISEVNREKAVSPVEKVLSKGVTVGLANHTLLISKQGKEIPIADSGAPVLNEEGQVSGVVLVFRDRTKEREKSRKILESEKKYKTLFNNRSIIMLLIDPESGNIVDANPAAEQFYGWSVKQLKGKNIAEINQLSEKEIHKDIELAKAEERNLFMFRHQLANGEIRDVEVYSNPIEIGGIPLLFSIIHDVTRQNEQEEQRKQAEIKLAESEKHFRLFYENAPILYQSLDIEGNILEVNDVWLRTLGYKREEVVGHSIKEYLTEESVGILQEIFPKFISTGRVHNIEYELVSKNKEKIVVVIEGLIATDKSGKFQRTHCVLHNVTERRHAEQQIRLLSRSVEQSPVSVIITDINGGILYVNPKFTEVTGYSGEEAIGKTPDLLKSGEHPPSFYKKLWNTILSGNEWRGEFRNKKKNGEFYWDSSTISPILNEKGDIAYFVGVQEDVTEKKRLHDELVKAKEKAEESDRLKSAFLANISHEIRTPMNGILGFMDLLSEPELEESTKNRYIDIINKSGERLMTTINDIIEISKLEAGQLKVQISDVDISAVMDYLFGFFKHQADETGIQLKVNNRLSGTDAIIRADRQKLEGVLINLIRNAIKFTRKGFVEFGSHLENGQLLFYVRDTGIGIPTDRLKAIFDRFVQADIKLTRPYEGSGLGLSIAKGYTELLGGKIEVESEEGKGSTFNFFIPFQPAKSRIRKTAATSFSKGKPRGKKLILITEDDEISNLLLEEIFAEKDFELLHTVNGEDAVKASKEHPDIDLILMDIRLPGMNGIEATQQIRKFNKKVPILAQTAYAMPGDKENALKAGCNDYISKPIDKQSLLAKINRLLMK